MPVPEAARVALLLGCFVAAMVLALASDVAYSLIPAIIGGVSAAMLVPPK